MDKRAGFCPEGGSLRKFSAAVRAASASRSFLEGGNGGSLACSRVGGSDRIFCGPSLDMVLAWVEARLRE